MWLALLAGLGTILGAYLVYTRTAHTPTYCPLGTGCDVVQSSRYAAVFGVPIALLGLGYYAGLFVLGLRRIPEDRRWALTMPLAGAGVGASAVFTIVQQTAIRATCSLCLVSALLTLAIFLLLVIRRPHRARAATWGWTSAFGIAAVAFLAAGYAASAPQAAESDYASGLARHLATSGVKFYGAYWRPIAPTRRHSLEGPLPFFLTLNATPGPRSASLKSAPRPTSVPSPRGTSEIAASKGSCHLKTLPG